MYVSILSVFQIHKEYELHIYVGSLDLEDEDIIELEALASRYDNVIHLCHADANRLEETLIKYDIFGYMRRVWKRTGIHSLLVYSIFDLLPHDLDRVIRIHSDTIVRSSLASLYFEGLDKYSVVTLDTKFAKNPGNDYCKHKTGKDGTVCEFFSLYNLEKLRDKDLSLNNILSGIPDLSEEEALGKYRPQIFGNYDYLFSRILGDDVGYCDSLIYNYFTLEQRTKKWSITERDSARRRACIIHYDTEQPWNCLWKSHPLNKIWWSYARLTPFYRNICNRKALNWINKLLTSATVIALIKSKKNFVWYRNRIVYFFLSLLLLIVFMRLGANRNIIIIVGCLEFFLMETIMYFIKLKINLKKK